MSNIPLALQLYSVREDAAKDLAGVIEAVAKMGYDGVEFAGWHGFTATQTRKMLDDNGLKCCGCHTGIQTLLGDELEKTIAFNQEIGNKFLIVPGLGAEYNSSKANWLKTAGIMNEISAKLEPLGMYTGYHNHHTEFQLLDGEMPWDTFFGNTDKRVVMQFDVGNAAHGGSDAAPFLKAYPGRALTVHVKEYPYECIVGEGDVNWPEIFELCETIGATQWYIVEQEGSRFSAMESAEISIKNLRGMGK